MRLKLRASTLTRVTLAIWCFQNLLDLLGCFSRVCVCVCDFREERKIKCQVVKSDRIKRFQRWGGGVGVGTEGEDGWGGGGGDAGVLQRRELVVMQSHRALLSALNTSISVCRGQNQTVSLHRSVPIAHLAVLVSIYLFIYFFTKTSKRREDEERLVSVLHGFFFLPWCPGWKPSSLDLAAPVAWTQTHGSLHTGGLEGKKKHKSGTINHFCLNSVHWYLC